MGRGEGAEKVSEVFVTPASSTVRVSTAFNYRGVIAVCVHVTCHGVSVLLSHAKLHSNIGQFTVVFLVVAPVHKEM